MLPEKPFEVIPYAIGFFMAVLLALPLYFSSSGDEAYSFGSQAGLKENRDTVSDDISITLPPEPDIKAEALIVKIVGNNNSLFKRREDKKLAPASLTKLLTAVVVVKNSRPADQIIFSPAAKAVGEKVSQVLPEEILGRDDVLKFLLMESANDAAAALAEYIPGFVNIMNREALRIGMSDSHFVNPTGLDEEDHYSSARDLAILSEYIWNSYPKLWQITRDIEMTVKSDQGREYTIKNTNELLKEFPAMRGGKTGFTDKAKGALILLYPTKTGETAVIVILKSEDRFGDGRKIIRWIESAS